MSVSRSSAGYSHVVVVVEENYSGPAIVGGEQAPYLKTLAAQDEYFPSYRAVTHPSEENYLALFSGSTQHTDASDSGIKTSARSIVGEARAASVSVEGYIEDLSSDSHYACRHNGSANSPTPEGPRAISRNSRATTSGCRSSASSSRT